jgi:four helix bundle protein
MFENMQVCRKAVDFADRVAAMVGGFPRGSYFLVDQLNRAALSVATNLAERDGRSGPMSPAAAFPRPR